MNSLIEKRAEYEARARQLRQERAALINERVNAYRAQLEAEPMPAELAKYADIIAALDQVIALENNL